MRLDRLLHLVVVLANRKRVAAKELADRFGVSVRTIYRDVETIGQAGIPVVSYPGQNGGLGLAEGYRLDRNVFSEEELASTLVALRGVAEASGDPHADAVQEKIWAAVAGPPAERLRERTGRLAIDPSGWAPNPGMKERVALLKQAAAERRLVRFRYGSMKGEELQRHAEPYTLVLKCGIWYLYAFCRMRQAFRLFKLTRMAELALTETVFEGREVNLSELPWDGERSPEAPQVELLMRFHVEHRLLAEDWFGADAVEEEPESGGAAILVRVTWPEDEWLYGFLLQVGDRMELLEPKRLRGHLRDRALRVAAQYSET